MNIDRYNQIADLDTDFEACPEVLSEAMAVAMEKAMEFGM